MNQTGKEKNDDQDEILYHYCSTTAFHSIITGRNVWLSLLSQSNDSMEGRLPLHLLTKAARDRKYDESVVQELVHAVKQKQETFDAFALCFSKEKDLLSQWRGYADDGNGICIGFSKKYIETSIRTYPELFRLDLTFHNAIYEEDKQLESINKFLDRVKHRLDDSKLHGMLNEWITDRMIDPDMLKMLFTFKLYAFREENEVRLIHTLGSRGQGRYHAANFCPLKNKIKPYIPLRLQKGIFMDFPDFESLKPIREIWLGPQHSTAESIIYAFLEKNQLSSGALSIHRSTATYRNR